MIDSSGVLVGASGIARLAPLHRQSPADVPRLRAFRIAHHGAVLAHRSAGANGKAICVGDTTLD